MNAAESKTEQLAGSGDIIDVARQRIARLPYRVRIVHPGHGTRGRVGQVALALDLSPEEAAFLKSAGRLTLRLEDGRELDFLIIATEGFNGFVQVPTFNYIRHPRWWHPAVNYVRDDARRRIRIWVRHMLPIEDFLTMVERQLSENTWTYATIYDLRAVHGAPSPSDVAASAQRVGGLIEAHGPRGPVAVVTRSMEMIGAVQAYALDSALGGHPVEVFSSLDDAEYWVSHRLSARP